MSTHMRSPQPPTQRRCPSSSLSVDEGSGCVEASLRPYRHLAIRVLERALRDVANPGGSSANRDSARMFLAGSSMLLYWCRVAALDPSCVVKHAENLESNVQWTLSVESGLVSHTRVSDDV